MLPLRLLPPLLLLLAGPAPGEPSAPEVAVGGTDFFRVLAPDRASLASAEKILAATSRELGDWLGPAGIAALPTMTLRLAPPGYGGLGVDRWQPYGTATRSPGAVIAWDKRTTVASFSRTVWRTVLPAVTGGRAAPAWLTGALALRVGVDLRPLRRRALQERARGEALPTLEGWPGRGDPAAAAAPGSLFGYWLLELIRTSLPTRSQPDIFLALARGTPPREVLAGRADRLPALASGPEYWWTVGCQDLLHRAFGKVLTRADSRAALGELARLRLPDGSVTSVGRGGDRPPLWEARRDPALREQVRTRIHSVALLLPRIHPLSHGPLFALGLALEALAGRDERAWEEAVAEFRRETVLARARAARIGALLGESPAGPPGTERRLP